MLACLLAAGCTSVDTPASLSAHNTPRMEGLAGEFSSSSDFPIHGTDVSKYQGDIDWHAAKAGNVMFAWIKATEGGDMVDPYFAANWRAAKRAGVPRGAYHFWYMCRNGAEQLAWFIENVPKDPEALPPVLDMEWNHLSPTCGKRPERAVLLRDMRVFLEGVHRHYGKRPIIYTSVDFHEDRLVGEFNEYPFWIRSVADLPHVRYPGRHWTFWQYTGTGTVPGITGEADRNVFNGDRRQWQAWLAENTAPDADFLPSPAGM